MSVDRRPATAPREQGAAPGASGVQGEARFALALLLPAAIVVFGVVLYPVARTFVLSLFDVNSPLPGDYPFVGLSNYTRALPRPGVLRRVLGHTLYFTLVSTGLELVLGIAVALLLNAPLRARWLWRSHRGAAVGAAHDRQRRPVALDLQRPVRRPQRRCSRSSAPSSDYRTSGSARRSSRSTW